MTPSRPDRAADSLVKIRIKERCATCAFREGTEANTDKVTQLKIHLCAETGSQFLCHESEREAMCAGFHNVLLKRTKQDSWKSQPQWKRDLGVKLLEILNLAERAQEPFNPHELVRRALESVGELMSQEQE